MVLGFSGTKGRGTDRQEVRGANGAGRPPGAHVDQQAGASLGRRPDEGAPSARPTSAAGGRGRSERYLRMVALANKGLFESCDLDEHDDHGAASSAAVGGSRGAFLAEPQLAEEPKPATVAVSDKRETFAVGVQEGKSGAHRDTPAASGSRLTKDAKRVDATGVDVVMGAPRDRDRERDGEVRRSQTPVLVDTASLVRGSTATSNGPVVGGLSAKWIPGGEEEHGSVVAGSREGFPAQEKPGVVGTSGKALATSLENNQVSATPFKSDNHGSSGALPKSPLFKLGADESGGRKALGYGAERGSASGDASGGSTASAVDIRQEQQPRGETASAVVTSTALPHGLDEASSAEVTAVDAGDVIFTTDGAPKVVGTALQSYIEPCKPGLSPARGVSAGSPAGNDTTGMSAGQAGELRGGAEDNRDGGAGGKVGGSQNDVDSNSSDDELFNATVKTDHYGFFVTSDRRGLDIPPDIAKARRLKEWKRSDKWRTMMDSFEDWQRGRKAKRLRSRVRKGVPDCVRGKVWQMMMGSTAMMDREPNKYADLLASDLPVEGPIEEDIPRTMYDHEMFCRKSRVDGRNMLRRVLTAYGRYDREVQYCQGINYICALFLLYMPEENAFWLLVASMQRPRAPLRELFLPGMVKAQEFQFVVDSLTEKHCHKLSAQILGNNLTPAMYATQWFLTAFTQRFPYDLVTRVWDMFLLEDWKVFYRVCLALFKAVIEMLKAKEGTALADGGCLGGLVNRKSVEEEAHNLDLEDLNLLLRNMPPQADAQKILKIAADIPLKHRHIEKRIALFYKERSAGEDGGRNGTTRRFGKRSS